MRHGMVSFLVFFTFLLAHPVAAEAPPIEGEMSPSFSLAALDIIQPKFEEQDGKIVFSMIVDNRSDTREQYFPGIEFAQLDGEKLKNVVVQRLPDPWIFQAREVRPIEFTLSTPTFLNGDYRLSLGVVDAAGRTAGRKFIGSQQFSSTQDALLKECTFDGRSLTDPLDFRTAPSQDAEFICEVQGISEDTELRVWRTKSAYLVLDDLDQVTVPKDADEVRLSLDKQLPVGAYQIELALTDKEGRVLSAPLRTPVTLAGVGGRILGIADVAADAIKGEQVIPIAFHYELYGEGKYQTEVVITTNGVSCGEPVVKEIGMGKNVAMQAFTIHQSCENPMIVAKLLSDGVELHRLEKSLVTSSGNATVIPNQKRTESMEPTLWERGKSFFWLLLPWSLVGVIILTLAYRRLRMARMLVFLLGAMVFGMWQSPTAQAGTTAFFLWYLCGGACPAATGVFYDFSTSKDTYAPGETIEVYFHIGSDDNPQGFCPVARLGINGGSYTGDQIGPCYSAQDFRDGLDFVLYQTAPSTPGPFTLNFSVGLNGYVIPAVQSIPLNVSAPTTCTWAGGPIAWGPGNACSAYAGPVTLNIGQYSGPYPNTNAGYVGSLQSQCTASGWSISSSTCTAIPPSVSITSTGPVALEEKSWWQKTFSFLTGYDSVVLAGGTTVITAGQNGQISWSSSNAGSCSITGSGAAAGFFYSPSPNTSGNLRIPAMAAGTYVYTISCTGPGGSSSDSTTIIVNPATCTWPGGNLTWGAGCQVFQGAMTLNVGQNTGLLSNTNSAYVGTVRYDCTASGWQAVSPICTPASIQTPTGLTATTGACGSGQINLTWNPVAGATAYSIRADGVTIYTGPGTSTTHNVVNNGALHSYNVNVTTGAGTSSWSAPANATAPNVCGTAPGTPTGLSASPAACGTGQINISWGNVSGATSYQLRDGGVVIYDGAATSFAHTGLAAGSSHSYTVRATNASGSSSYSGSIASLAPSGTCGSSAPTTTATPGACGSGTINVSWNNVAGTASYQLRRDGTSIEVGTATSYAHTGLTGGSNHNYQTQSTPFSGSPTGFGNLVTANAPNNCGTPPPAPTGLQQDSPTCGNNPTVYISWNAVPSADWFHFYVDGTWVDQIPSSGTMWSYSFELGSTHSIRVYSENAAGMSVSYASVTVRAGSTTACPECTGTKPTGGIAHPGDDPPSTSRAWQYSATDTARDCQFYCHPSYTWDGTTCYSPHVCTGTRPANSQILFQDDEFLTADTPYTYSPVNNAAIKCEYRCQTGYVHDVVEGADVCVPQNYLIRSTTGPNGTIAPLGNALVPYKGNRTYTMTPNTGYVVDDVVVDGVSQGPLANYTFSSVTTTHTIGVTFISSSSTYIQASPTSCIIADGNDSCTSYLTWNAPTAATPQVKMNSTGTVVYAGATGANMPVSVPYPGMRYDLADGATVLDTTPMITAQCGAGSVWNGTMCQAAAATGSITSINPATCSIPVGGASCTVQVSWTTSGASNPRLLIPSASPGDVYAPVAVNQLFTIPYGTHVVTLQDVNLGVDLDTDTVAATCASGAAWDGTICVAAPTVDLKINGSDGPLSLGSGDMTLSWSTSNATGCSATGPGWTGAKPISSAGEIIPAFTGTYTLTCTNGTVDSTDSVDITLACAPSCTTWSPCGPPCSGGEGTQSRTCTTATCIVTPQTQSCSTDTCRDLNWKEIGQ